MTQPASPDDPLAELREQIRATTAAAARLAAETAEAHAAPREPAVPPAGWATPDGQAAHQQELAALIALVEALRDLVPAEFRQQLRDVLRQLLLLARALVDWWVERMDGSCAPSGRGDAPAVQEIPIE